MTTWVEIYDHLIFLFFPFHKRKISVRTRARGPGGRAGTKKAAASLRADQRSFQKCVCAFFRVCCVLVTSLTPHPRVFLAFRGRNWCTDGARHQNSCDFVLLGASGFRTRAKQSKGERLRLFPLFFHPARTDILPPPPFFWRHAPKFLPRCALRAKFVRIPRSAPKQMAAPKKTANELKKARTVGSTNTIQGEQRATGSFDSWAEADGRLVRFDRITAVEELNNLGAEFVQGVLKDMIINVNYVKILVIFVYEKYATNGHSNVRKLAEMPSRRFFSLGRKPS